MTLQSVIQIIKKKYIGLSEGYYLDVTFDNISICLCSEDKLAYYYAGEYEHCSYYVKGFFFIKDHVQFYIEQNEVPRKIEDDYIGDIPENVYIEAKRIAHLLYDSKLLIRNSLAENNYSLEEYVKKPYDFSILSHQHIRLKKEPWHLSVGVNAIDLEITDIYVHFDDTKSEELSIDATLKSKMERYIFSQNPSLKLKYLLREKE